MDIISKYKKAKKLRIIYILSTSFALALALNITLFFTDTWQSIKTSVLDNTINKKINSWIYIEKEGKDENIILKLKTNQKINNVKSFSISLFYNPENVKILDIFWNDNDFEIITLSKEDWILSLILNYKTPKNINQNNEIIKIAVKKKDYSKIEQINIANTNFTDKDNAIYELSASWIDF